VATYQEKESGKKDTRPVRYTLLKSVWRKEIDAILVWKLDRWGRSIRDLINTIMDLHEHNVGFVSFSDNLDLTTAQGRLTFHLLAAIAEFERETIVSRVRAGVEKKRARMKELGREWGRPAKAREKSVEVKRLFAAGKSKAAISRATGISRASVLRIIQATENPPTVNSGSR
jgi:DNA invertase Pin-like site-specific DNA recombinase